MLNITKNKAVNKRETVLKIHLVYLANITVIIY